MFKQFQSNPLDIDNNTGLFGLGSSHSGGFAWLLLLSLQFIFRYNLLIIFFEYLIMVPLALVCENKFFLLFSPIVILLSFVTSGIFKKKSFFWIAIFSFTAFFIFLIFYSQNNNPFKFVSDSLISLGDPNDESSERTVLLIYLLKLREVYFLGFGSGTLSHVGNLFGRDFDTIIHLGMNDLMTIMYEMGIGFFIILLIFYTFICDELFQNKRLWRMFLIFGFLFFVNYYANFFSDPRLIYYFSLLLFSMVWNIKNSYKRYKDSKCILKQQFIPLKFVNT